MRILHNEASEYSAEIGWPYEDPITCHIKWGPKGKREHARIQLLPLTVLNSTATVPQPVLDWLSEKGNMQALLEYWAALSVLGAHTAAKTDSNT